MIHYDKGRYWERIDFEDLNQYLENNEWNKFVIIRDPLVRFLSAFLEKCLHAKWCLECHTCYTILKNTSVLSISEKITMFRTFVAQVINGTELFTHDHYKPQVSCCNLHDHLESYDKVFYWTMGKQFNLEKVALEVLSLAGKSMTLKCFYTA